MPWFYKAISPTAYKFRFGLAMYVPFFCFIRNVLTNENLFDASGL